MVDSDVNILDSLLEAGDKLIDPMLESLRSCLSGFFVGVSLNLSDFFTDAAFFIAGDVNSKSSSSKLRILVAGRLVIDGWLWEVEGWLKEVDGSLSASGAPNSKFLEEIFLDVGLPRDMMFGLSVDMISYLVHCSKVSLSNSASRSCNDSRSSISACSGTRYDFVGSASVKSS